MKPLDLVTAKRQIDDFVDYVDSFYGQNDPLYPFVYLDQCQNDDFEFCTWGDGDSLDRERVRDILLDKFNYDHKNGTW